MMYCNEITYSSDFGNLMIQQQQQNLQQHQQQHPRPSPQLHASAVFSMSGTSSAGLPSTMTTTRNYEVERCNSDTSSKKIGMLNKKQKTGSNKQHLHQRQQPKYKRRFCRVPNCQKVVKSQGKCQQHGAKISLCQIKSCTKQSQGGLSRPVVSTTGRLGKLCKGHYNTYKNKQIPALHLKSKKTSLLTTSNLITIPPHSATSSSMSSSSPKKQGNSSTTALPLASSADIVPSQLLSSAFELCNRQIMRKSIDENGSSSEATVRQLTLAPVVSHSNEELFLLEGGPMDDSESSSSSCASTITDDDDISIVSSTGGSTATTTNACYLIQEMKRGFDMGKLPAWHRNEHRQQQQQQQQSLLYSPDPTTSSNGKANAFDDFESYEDDIMYIETMQLFTYLRSNSSNNNVETIVAQFAHGWGTVSTLCPLLLQFYHHNTIAATVV